MSLFITILYPQKASSSTATATNRFIMNTTTNRRSRPLPQPLPNPIMPFDYAVPTSSSRQTACASVNSTPARQLGLKRCVTLEDDDKAALESTNNHSRRKRRRVHHRREKCVSFSDSEAEVIPTQANDAAAAAKEKTWYTRQDYAAFRQDMKVDYLIHELLKRRSPDAAPLEVPEDHCIRGLEKICTSSSSSTTTATTSNATDNTTTATTDDISTESIVSSNYKEMRHQRITAVLDQQRVQRIIGMADPEILSTIAQVLSKRACDQALLQAAEDAKIWEQHNTM